MKTRRNRESSFFIESSANSALMAWKFVEQLPCNFVSSVVTLSCTTESARPDAYLTSRTASNKLPAPRDREVFCLSFRVAGSQPRAGFSLASTHVESAADTTERFLLWPEQPRDTFSSLTKKPA
jgi:hypothetical protein